MKYFPEINFLKGVAILFVLLLHSLSRNCLLGSYAVFHIGQAVPIFFMVTFFLAFHSLSTKEYVFRDWFSKIRLIRLFKRIMLPVLVLTCFQVLVFGLYGNVDMIKKMLIRGGGDRGPIIVGNICRFGSLLPSCSCC